MSSRTGKWTGCCCSGTGLGQALRSVGFGFLGLFNQPAVASGGPITAWRKHSLQDWIPYYVKLGVIV